MSRKTNDASSNPAMPFSGVGRSSQIADANTASDTRAAGIEIDRGVPSWSVAEYETHYVYKLEARRFGVMFSDGSNSFWFDHWNDRQDTDVGAWIRR